MAKAPVAENEEKSSNPRCGIAMPISGFGVYESTHWLNVKDLITRAISTAGMSAHPVWEGGNIEVIHGRIVLNLYEMEYAVIDASGLNPNVMFELGMRLTYGKPTVLVADDSTELPFDTRIVEHVIYPRSLVFHKMETFIGDVAQRLVEVRKSKEDGTYRSFIESLGTFKVAEPLTEKTDPTSLIMERLDRLESTLSTPKIWRQSAPVSEGSWAKLLEKRYEGKPFPIKTTPAEFNSVIERLKKLEPSVRVTNILKPINGLYTIFVAMDEELSGPDARKTLSELLHRSPGDK